MRGFPLPGFPSGEDSERRIEICTCIACGHDQNSVIDKECKLEFVMCGNCGKMLSKRPNKFERGELGGLGNPQ